jgi:hypothetical protein
MDRTREYYRLFVATLQDLIKERVGTRDFVILGLTALLGFPIVYFWRGKEFMIDEIVSFIAFSMLPFSLLALGYVAKSFIDTPVRIYTGKKSYLQTEVGTTSILRQYILLNTALMLPL